MPTEIEHPILGTLEWNESLNSWESTIELRSTCPVDFRLVRRKGVQPHEEIDELLERGVELLEWARRSEALCRDRIADKLLEIYNDAWATDGPMSRAAFCECIEPCSLVRDISGSGYFYWSADDLFDGHWIELRFRNDLTISTVNLAG